MFRRNARTGRGGFFSEAVGLRSRPEDRLGSGPSSEKDFPGNRSTANRGPVNRPSFVALFCVRQTDAIRIFRWKLDRNPSRDERQAADGAGRIPSGETRSFCPAPETAGDCPRRCASVWTRTISSWPVRAGLVAIGRSGYRFRQVRWRVSERLPLSPRARADQSRPAAAKRFSWNRKLDGGRDPLAGQDCAGDFSRSVVSSATLAFAARDAVCGQRSPADHRSRFLRSAIQLADPSKMETRRRLPTPSHAPPARPHRRPDDSLVCAMPEELTDHMDHDPVKSRRT